jgi:hypothetical protein
MNSTTARKSDDLSTFEVNDDGTVTVVRFGMRLNTFTSLEAAQAFAARTFWIYA